MSQSSNSGLPLVWINGEIHESPETAKIPALDPGYQLGLGLFETLPLISGQPICLTRHYIRLCEGAKALGIAPPSLHEIESAIAMLNSREINEARLRITLSGEPESPPTLVISAVPLEIPSVPAKVAHVSTRRNPTSPIAGLKSTCYSDSVLSLREAKAKGAEEGILCDTGGNLSEGCFSNLFYARSGQLHTPPLSTGCLPGITRELILELCEKHGRSVYLDPLPASSLNEADEAFLTTSIRQVQPIGSVDGVALDVAPGPITEEIAYWLVELLSENPDPQPLA